MKLILRAVIQELCAYLVMAAVVGVAAGIWWLLDHYLGVCAFGVVLLTVFALLRAVTETNGKEMNTENRVEKK